MDSEIEIKPEEISISTYRTGGAWSNRENGVKIVHIPTGEMVWCEDTPSLHRNKCIAIQELIDKLEIKSKI